MIRACIQDINAMNETRSRGAEAATMSGSRRFKDIIYRGYLVYRDVTNGGANAETPAAWQITLL